jgi:hypothetical protein
MLLKATSPLLRLGSKIAAEKTHDVIFIWIPKAAGTSIHSLFEPFGMGKYKSIDQTRYRFPGSGMATFVHQSVPALVAAGAIRESYVESAFKFAFVRNPYDRAVSLYHYFRRYDRMPKALDFGAFLEVLGEQWEKNQTAPQPTEAMLSPRVRYRGEFVSQKDHTLHPVGLYNVYGWSQCRPQVDWLQGMGGIDQIHLGRMENIDNDVKTILRGIFGSSQPDLDRALAAYGDAVPRRNATPHRPYGEHYSDPGLLRLVEVVYQKDFKTLGY